MRDIVKEEEAESTRGVPTVQVYEQGWFSKPEAVLSSSCGNRGGY